MIEIDGSMGEGGGQMLRSALSLSCLTGKGFRMVKIRQGRAKPGLMPQHLVAAQAAARIAAAQVTGDRLGSQELIFRPGAVSAGNYNFDIGTAGSAPLVLQTLIPPLLACCAASRLTLIGGTHVPFSPSWQYLAEVFAPTLARLGARIQPSLESCGFYPKGGGKVRCLIEPVGQLAAFSARERGKLLRVSGCSAVGNLPRNIAERQARSALALLRCALGEETPMEVEIGELTVFGQGSFIFLKGEYQQGLAGFTALGARGKPAESVGEEAACQFLGHHRSGLPVDPHLADQLVPYLARARGPSVFATSRLSSHLETNLQVTGYFLDFGAQLTGERDGPGTVAISPRKQD